MGIITTPEPRAAADQTPAAEARARVLRLFARSRVPLTPAQCAALTGIDPQVVRAHVNDLEWEGDLIQTRGGETDYSLSTSFTTPNRLQHARSDDEAE